MIVMILVAGTTLHVFAATQRILQPSFETVSSWTYSAEDPQYSGAQSTDWKTHLSNSYFLAGAIGTISALAHCQIAQTVNMSLIDTLSFDLRGYNDKASADVVHSHIYIDTVEAWTQVLPATVTDYNNIEVDFNSYTGSSVELAFALEAHDQASGASFGAYFDNIMLLGSFSDSNRTTVDNDFTSTSDVVYFCGETFDLEQEYTLGVFDAGGTKLADTSFTETTGNDGIMDTISIQPSSYSSATDGTWHAVIYKGSSTPASYLSVDQNNADYVITDSFNVTAAAIPEFPTILSAVFVVGACFAIYYWMRRRGAAHVQV
ncbi:hypothetical protein ACFLV3_04920 [Chloroflexota bacterium]